MINEKRYLSVKQIFEDLEVNTLTENEIVLYGDMFEIISQLIHNKLTDREMVTAYDILLDTADGKNLKFAVYVPKSDRIKVQLRLMEELPETAGKLTFDEKVKFAFCVYYSYFIELYDEERQGFFKGLVEFTSVKKILDLMEEAKRINPTLFDFNDMAGVPSSTNSANPSSEKRQEDINNTNNQAGDYGYSKSNPILVPSVPSSYIYLNALKYPNAKSLKYVRRGSLTGSNGEILDQYQITVTMADDSVKEFELYINPYAAVFAKIAPEGFVLSLPNHNDTANPKSLPKKRKGFLARFFKK